MFKDIKIKYKNRLRDYMNVYVCDTFEEMYRLENKLENTHVEEDYGTRTWCYSRKFYSFETEEYVKTSPLCGHMIFNKEYFFMDTISHESAHAVIGYFARKLQEYKEIFDEIDENGNLINEHLENEELFCYMVGNIADQIVGGYNDKRNV